MTYKEDLASNAKCVGRYKVYLAGAISGLTFQRGNQWREALAAELTKLGIESFNPLAPDKKLNDGRVIKHADYPEGVTGEDIFNRDKNWIDQANLVVANFNAPHFSPGTMWEIGYAYGQRIPVIAFGDVSQLSHPFVCIPCKVVEKTELISAIKSEATKANLCLEVGR
jgi:nucleoside 2-deoxyribosyltransferase